MGTSRLRYQRIYHAPRASCLALALPAIGQFTGQFCRPRRSGTSGDVASSPSKCRSQQVVLSCHPYASR